MPAMPDEVLLGLIERLAVPILLVDGEGLVLGANRYMARIGIEPGRLAGMPLSAMTAQPPEVVHAYLRRCSRTSDPLPGSLVFKREGGGEVACRADGAVVHAASGARPAVVLVRLELKDDGVGRFLALNQKIDDLGKEIRRRKRIEGDLREQKEWLGVTLTSIGDAVIATDTEGRVIFMNPVAEVLTGWDRGEAGGRELGEVFRIINEESRELVENPVAKCLREGTVVGLANHTILIARDGTEYAIDDTAAPIRDEGGDLKGVVLVFHDVGDRSRLERELHDRADRLAENDRRKDEFLAMLAHELRNPLASIHNAAQLFGKLRDEAGLRWAQEVVLRQVKHLARLIDDLLDASRISRGKIDLRRESSGLA
jgi:PAS domain S-box-containing protein